jgi:rRNA biogenesis protein RRP5
MTVAQTKRKGNRPDESGSLHFKKRVKLAHTDRSNAQDPKKSTVVKAGHSREDGQSDRSKRSSDRSSKHTTLSYLRDEEPSFPRGGGSILTPLERKQIQIQATRDLLFEQGETNGADGIDGGDGDAAHRRGVKSPATKSRKVKAKSKKVAQQETLPGQGVRIEGLNFKVCSLGPEIREMKDP